jgi:hypothetical protein
MGTTRRAGRESILARCRIGSTSFVALVMATPDPREASIMWDTVQTTERHLSHDLPCPGCGHAAHTYLPCGDDCACARSAMPGATLDLAA